MQDHRGQGQPDSGSNLPAPMPIDRRQVTLRPQGQGLSVEVKPAEGSDDSEQIDLLSYWRILVKRRWTVLGAMAIVLVSALVATLLTTPVYRADVTLQIERDNVRVVEVGATESEGRFDDSFYSTQLELLRSRALAQRVAGDLGITEQSHLDVLMPRSPLRRALSFFNRSGDAGKATDEEQAAIQEQLGMVIQSGLTVGPIRDTRLVRISFDSVDREFAVRAANAVAAAFIATTLERRMGSSGYAKEYLEDRLAELKLKLEDSERELVQFAQREKIISSGGNTGTLSEQSLGSLNAAIGQARQDRIKAESRWRQAQASRGTVLMGDLGENSIIKALQQSRAELMAEYQDKLRLYKPAYPLMQQLKGQIDEVNKQIAAEANNVKASIQAEYLAAQEQERLLSEQMSFERAEVLDLQGRSIQYNIFKREVDTNRELYDGLLQRYKEIGVAAGVTVNNIAVVDGAERAGKFKPDMLMNLLLGLFLGLVLGVLLALGFEYLDDTLKAPEDVEKLLGLAVLGVIPRLKPPLTPEKALDDPRSAFSESYRSVRTALQFATDAGVPRCLLVTSATPAEGKSTTALTLARNFAQLGKRVLIIDADLRNPSLHRSLNVENSSGLSNYLAGAVKATEVICVTDMPHLMFMPTGPLPPNPAELLLGPKMLSLLSIASEKFDQVIIDGPPVMGLADAPILANMATGTLLVIEAGETRIAVARNALKRLLSARAHIVGALLTKHSAKHSDHGYGAYSYYSYGTADQPKKLTKR